MPTNPTNSKNNNFFITFAFSLREYYSSDFENTIPIPQIKKKLNKFAQYCFFVDEIPMRDEYLKTAYFML